ncbi:RNA polymerase sigma factor [Sorangium sp. So ce145]|uniref:RNA polymerase sigma factor n=1 Tax=Sorangium sp. So ce145 TaxID=3133285 RepID=UPI003F605388
MGEPGRTPTGFKFLRRLARRSGVPARHAEDVAQEALLRGLEADQRLDLGEGRAAYGATIVLNQARNHVRNARRRGEVLTSFDDHELQAEGPTPEEMLRKQQREALLRDLISQVDPRYRDVLIKHELEEVPLVEIASELGLNPKTVKTHHLRALKDLAAAVKRRRARQHPHGGDDVACVPFAFGLRGREGWLSKLGRLGIKILAQGAVVVLTGAVLSTLPDSFNPESWLRAVVARAPAPAPAVEEVAPPPAQLPMRAAASPTAQEIARPAQGRDARGLAPSGAPVRRSPLPVRAVVPAVSEREQRLIDEARRAIEDHDAVAEARRSLETHAREFPQGQLAAEREALLTRIR